MESQRFALLPRDHDLRGEVERGIARVYAATYGARLTAFPDVLAALMLAAMRRNLPPHLRNVQLMAGTFGSRASLIGAAVAARGSQLWKEFAT